jgi:hypothetical protein
MYQLMMTGEGVNSNLMDMPPNTMLLSLRSCFQVTEIRDTVASFPNSMIFGRMKQIGATVHVGLSSSLEI